MRSWLRWALVAMAVGVLVVQLGSIVSGLGTLQEQPPARPTSTESMVLAVRPADNLPGVGASVESRVSETGDLEVTHWIRTRTPLEVIRVLPVAHPGSGEVRGASSVTVAGDGVILVRDDQVGVAGEVYVFAEPVRLVYLSYVIKGAADLDGSIEGRAMVRAAMLDVEYRPRRGPTLVAVTGVVVRSLACSGRQSSLTFGVPCGAPAADGWSVRLTGEHLSDRVSAQVDLASGALGY